MADDADDLSIPIKPARMPAQGTVAAVTRAATAIAPRAGDAPRPADSPRPLPEHARTTELQRRASEAAASAAARRAETDVRSLIVGREISLSGEITSCDKLVVEGSVEANLQNCREIDISETGLFKGSAAVEEAEMRGRFEGSLVVRKRLLIRASGKVSGTIRYGQIEIECGGQISGDIQMQPADEFIGGAAPAARAAH